MINLIERREMIKGLLILIFLSCLLVLAGIQEPGVTEASLSTSSVGKSKFYDHVDTGKCSQVTVGVRNDERMKKNAVTEAKAWCSDAGGVKRGAETSDFTAATEGNGPYFCRVKGTIECNK